MRHFARFLLLAGLAGALAACGPTSRNALKVAPLRSGAEAAIYAADCENLRNGLKSIVKCVMVAQSPHARPDDQYIAHLQLCRLSVVRGDKPVAEGLKDCEEAIALKPEAADAHAAKSRALIRSHRYEEALASATTAIDLDGTHQDARLFRGFVLHVLDDDPGALGDIRTLKELQTASDGKISVNVWALEARVLITLDRLDDARAVTDAARADFDGNFMIERADAWIEIKRGNGEAAVAFADKSLKAEPRSVLSRIARGSAYMAVGDVEKSLSDFRIANKRQSAPAIAVAVVALEALVVVGKEALTELGHDAGGKGPEIDPQARRAMRAFQSANGLEADGRFTSESLQAVFDAAKIDKKADEAPDDLFRRLLRDRDDKELQT